MRKFLVAALLANFSVPAIAADPGLPMEQPPASFTWAGAYVGGQLGYAWGDSALEFESSSSRVHYDPDGAIGGIYAGYNHAFANNLVVGVETDFQFSGVDASDVRLVPAQGFPALYRFQSEQKWNGSLRARLAYDVDRLLPFLTAGVAFARYEHGQSFEAAFPFSRTETYTGWTLGGGVDYAMTDSVIVRAEYRYSDFGSENFSDVPVWQNHAVDLKTNDIRLGVAYKF